MAVNFYTTINAESFVKDGGTSTEYLMADGSTTTFAGITGSGTTNYLPKFTGSTSVGNSILFDKATSTAVPTQQIVDGSFANGSSDWAVGVGSWTVASGKATCNGTNAADPPGWDDVLNQVSTSGVSQDDSVAISFTISNRTTGTLNMYSYGTESTFVGNGAKTVTVTSNGNNYIYFYTNDGFDGSITAISSIADVGGFSGGIGVMTADPKAALDVNGAIRLGDSDEDDDDFAGTLRWATFISNDASSSKSALQIVGNNGWEDVIAFVQDYV
tara:strand:- start:140 stop:955 length:816 start_codon:yes stop_codon:yes gene_type:complete